MPDYQVGNLQIVFDAVDQTASAFEDLSKNLRAIKNVINNLGNIDTSKLNSLKKNLQDITKAFSPFLTKVKGASQGLADFNSTIKQIGVKNLSSVSSEIIDIAQKAQQATQAQEEFTHGIENGSAQATNALKEQKKVIDKLIAQQKVYEAQPLTKPELLKDITSYKEIIKELNQELANTKAAYALIVEGGKVGGFDNATIQTAQQLQQEINNTETTIQGLKEQLADLQTQFGAPFNEAQSAVSALKNELLNVYYATNTINNEQVQEWQRLTAKINETTNAVNRALMTTEEQVIADQKAAISANQQAIAYLKAQMALGRYTGTVEQYLAEIERLETEQRRLRGEIEQTNDTQEENDKTTKKTTNSWKKFLNQIKRVAIYRLIRTLLKAVVSTFRDTINAFAQVDDGVNETMSSLTSSLNIIKLSIGTSILPLLQMIEPIVSQIAVAFANLGNIISATFAKDGKFTKINAEYWEDYRKQIKETQGSLLDFDKFRVLNKQEGQLSGFLDPNASVEEFFANNEISESAERIKNIIYDISTAVSDLFTILRDIATPVLNTISFILEPIAETIKSVIEGIKKTVEWLKEVGALEPIIYTVATGLALWGGVKVITSITKLTSSLSKFKLGLGAVGIAIAGAFAIFNSWADMNTWQRIISIIGVATTAILGLAMAFGAFHSAWSLGLAAAGIVAGIGMIVASIGTVKQEASKPVRQGGGGFGGGYAQGGIPDKGTMFYAGEAGAEMVYNMPSGQSGVANISQIQQAMYNALVQYGRENPTNERPLIVQLDGKVIFDNTRQTAKRRGLGFGNI